MADQSRNSTGVASGGRETGSLGSPAVCPYCGGNVAGVPEGADCPACGGLLEPLSRQATQNGMGPWFVRDEHQPHRPGCALSVVQGMARRGRLTRDSVVRGPTTHQFWTLAGRTPGIAHLLGVCHACGSPAQGTDASCGVCGALFAAPDDRQFLGLGPVRLLPQQAPPQAVAQGDPGSGSRAGWSEEPGGTGGGPGVVDAAYARRLERRLRAQRHQTQGMFVAAVLLAMLSLGLWIGPRSGGPPPPGGRPGPRARGGGGGGAGGGGLCGGGGGGESVAGEAVPARAENRGAEREIP